MFSIRITRRQFLKWFSASAAAMGLSQTELLKIQEALAAGPACAETPTLGRVIWITGGDCGGCATTILNYIADVNDPDPILHEIANNFPNIPALNGYLSDADSDKNIDIAEVVLEIVTIDWAYIVMQGAGDLSNAHMAAMRDSTNTADNYVLMCDGTFLTGANGKFCRVFSMPTDKRGGIWDNYVTYDAGLDRTTFTHAGASLWLASSPRCQAVVAHGTCSSWGGIPAAMGSETDAKSAWEWLTQSNGLGVPVVNVPGCPPHPDWFIHTVGLALLQLNGIGPYLTNYIDWTTLDHKGRPLNTSKLIYDGVPFCDKGCPRSGVDNALKLCQAKPSAKYPNGRCLAVTGCNGALGGPQQLHPDCPTRMWNHREYYDGPGGSLRLEKNNWCVGNSYPCQGCTSPGFPDYTSPFFLASKYKP
jgi:hydrogenase small subunit